MDSIPHLSLPLRIEQGAYASVEQDTADELVACVACICSFPIGARTEAPEFGIPELELSDRPLPVERVQSTIETWEPRASVRVTEAPYDPTDPLADRLRIEVLSPGAEEVT